MALGLTPLEEKAIEAGTAGASDEDVRRATRGAVDITTVPPIEAPATETEEIAQLSEVPEETPEIPVAEEVMVSEDFPIATTQTETQQIEREEPREPELILGEEAADISMFTDASETFGVQPEDDGELLADITSTFTSLDPSMSAQEIEENQREEIVSEFDSKFKNRELDFHDIPIEHQREVLSRQNISKEEREALIFTADTVRYLDSLRKGPEELGPLGINLGIADRLAGHGLRGVAGMLDFLTYPVAWGVGKIPGVPQPSALQTLSHYFPKEDYEFPDAPDLVVDNALRVLGMGTEFAAAGQTFVGAFSGVTKLLSKVVEPGVSSQVFSTISDDLLLGLKGQVSFDTLAGASYQGTKEVLGEDSEALAIMNSILFPLMSSRSGRGLLLEGGKKSLKLVNKASDYTLITPLIKKAGANFLDEKASNIAREASRNPEEFSQGLGAWKKSFAEKWTAKRVAGIDETMIAKDAELYFKEIINFDDARVLERQKQTVRVEDEVNAWLKSSGNKELEELQMPVYLAYRGVTDNEALTFLETTYKHTFPEAHLKATRDRVATVQAFVEAKGPRATDGDVKLLSQMNDELIEAFDIRLQQEAVRLTPKAVNEVAQVEGAREREILSAGELRKTIKNVDEITDDTYVQLSERIDRDIPLSSETVLKTIDTIIAEDAKNLLTARKDVPSYAIEVFQKANSRRPEAALSPNEVRLNEIDVAKRQLDIESADKNQGYLQELSGFDVMIAEAKGAELAKLKKDRAHTVSEHKKDTAINTAKKKPMIAEEKSLELKVKQEKVKLGKTDQAALVAELVPVNTGEVVDAVKRVNKLLREEFRALQPDTVKIENLQSIKSSLEETMGTLSKGDVKAQSTLAQWERANSFYRTEIAERIDSTVLGNKYLSTTKDGKNFELYDEDIVNTAWDQAKLKDIEDTINLAVTTKPTERVIQDIAKDAQAAKVDVEELQATSLKLLEDYKALGISSLMKELATVKNTLGKNIERPEKYMEAMKKTALEWVDKNSAKIKRVPGLQGEVDRILANNEEFFQRIDKYADLVAAREGPEVRELLRAMGHSDEIAKIIKDNESSNALATAIEGMITEGYHMPKIGDLNIPELGKFQKVLGIRGAREFQDILTRQYRSSVFDGTTFNAQKVRADIENPSTRANMEKIFGEENVLALDVLSDTLMFSGIDDTVKTAARIRSGEEGIIGSVLDKALTAIAGNQQRLTSLGSLALRRARGFRPSAEWFQIYLGTEALKYMGNQGSAAYVKSIIENHRKLGNIDKALADLQKASQASVAQQVFESGASWHNLPLSYRNDASLSLRRVLQAVGLNISHQDSMAVVERAIRTEGGRKEEEGKTEVPEVEEIPTVPEVTAEPEIPEAPQETPGDTLREDGTKKGKGFLGELKMTDGSGRIMTEFSVGIEIDGKETLVPSIVPTLTREEVDSLRAGGNVTPSIIRKAAAHARKRIDAGKSPFLEEVPDET